MAESVADIVSVLFTAGGVSEVTRAFETVEQKMARFEKGASQTATRASKERVAVADKERKDRESMYARLFKDVDAKEKQSIKIRENSAKMAGQIATKQANEEIKAATKAEREKVRAAEQSARAIERIRDNSARMAGRLAEQQANAEIRASQRAIRETHSRNSRFAGNAGASVRGAVSGVVGGATMLAGAAMAIGGGAGFADSIREQLAFEKASAVLSNSAYINGGEGASGTRFSPAALQAKAKAIQAATNIEKGDVIAGMQSFVAKTGSAEILQQDDKSVLELAQLAKATGAPFADVMGAAGILRSQNKNLSTEQSSEMMRDIVAQGKLGSVEMSDLASIAGKITASSAMYQGDQGDAQRKLLGLSQIAIKTAGSPDEAATAITHLGADALKHKDKLAGLGLFDKFGNISSPEDLIAKSMGRAGGNLGKLQDLGFGERSIKTFEALAPTYQAAFNNASGSTKDKTSAAVAAVRNEVTGFTAAKFSKQDVANDLSVVMQQRAEKFDAAMIRLKEILADKGVPLFEKFMNALDRNMPAIESGLDSFTKFVEWFAENPLTGLGAVVVAKVTKDLAEAAIGEAVKRTLLALMSNQTAGNVVTGSGGGVAGKAGNGLAAAAGVAIAAFTADKVVNSAQGGAESGAMTVQKLFTDLNKSRQAVKEGTLSPEDAMAKFQTIKGQVATAEEGGDAAHAALAAVSAPLALVSGDARKDIGEYNKNKEISDNAVDLAKSLKMLKDAAEQAAAAQASAATRPTHPNNGDPATTPQQPRQPM